jgi:hypothetical protein
MGKSLAPITSLYREGDQGEAFNSHGWIDPRKGVLNSLENLAIYLRHNIEATEISYKSASTKALQLSDILKSIRSRISKMTPRLRPTIGPLWSI